MSHPVRTASSYWLLWIRVLLSLSLLLLAYVFEGMAPQSSIWLAPAALGGLLLLYSLNLQGVRFTETELRVRGLLGAKVYPLEAVVGLRHWLLFNHSRIQVIENGSIRSIWLVPNRLGLPESWMGSWLQRNIAYPKLEAILHGRIPENRHRAGLSSE